LAYDAFDRTKLFAGLAVGCLRRAQPPKLVRGKLVYWH